MITSSEDGPASPSWWSYDSVAGRYDSFLTPSHFLPPAPDLVALLDLPKSGRVLDVGTGTGVAARVAAEALHFEGFVVGVDPSLGMLQLAKQQATLQTAAAQVPGLPFHEGAFDVVMANFVLSHVSCYETALAEVK
jgi:ubiquinone/menaquinone biosynthesis C-methylase UbiE